MKYVIVGADGCRDLETKVNAYLRVGWRLEGGICALTDGRGWMFYQAMSFEPDAS